MKNPQEIESAVPGATYIVPSYEVTNDGLVDSVERTIFFCKGNKADSEQFRQAGFFTETLVATCKKYLEENNVGQLENGYTARAIDHLQKALDELAARAEDRKARDVQGTYQK